MNQLFRKKKALLSALVLVFSITSLLMMTTPNVYADAVSTCASYDKKELAGCYKGYQQGALGNENACDAFSDGAKKAACNVGYKQGKKDAAIRGSNDKCGSGDAEVKTSINIGCRGRGNAIVDMLFAFIRFLSAGVGLIIAGSLVFAGIQYTTSRGDPQATAAAVDRIQNSVMALLLFLFAYAILNYIVPGAVLR